MTFPLRKAKNEQREIIKYYLRGTIERVRGRITWRGEGFSTNPTPVAGEHLLTREECRHRAFEAGAAAEFVMAAQKSQAKPTRIPLARRLAEADSSYSM